MTLADATVERTLDGFRPNRYGMDVYYEVHLVARAMAAVGRPEDHLGVSERIGQSTIQTASGTVRFDSRTHLAVCADNAVPMRWYQFNGQDRTCLAPTHSGHWVIPLAAGLR